MARKPGARAWAPAAIGLMLLLGACQVPFKTRKSVEPERSRALGLQGPVEVAVHSPAWSQGGIIRIEGDATNFTNVPLKSCAVSFQFLDGNGTRVSMATAYTLGGLEPGEKWEFKVTATGVPITDKFYDVEIGRVVVTPK